MKKMKSYSVNIKLNTIQAIRLVSALMESDHIIYLNSQQRIIFNYLRQYFNIEYETGVKNKPILHKISINHQIPISKIGSIKKALIFPKNIFELCKSKWNNNREITYLFSGLLTKKRLTVLHKWIVNNSQLDQFRVNWNFLFIKILNEYIRRKTNYLHKGFSGNYSINVHKDDKLNLSPSTIGRNFPEKSWDDDYFNHMANSKFVLCPNGDFVWTYRFFEAIMCGAIPIVESETEIYNGFHYYKMSDPIDKYTLNEKHIDENYKLALNILTIKKNILNQEIENLLDQ